MRNGAVSALALAAVIGAAPDAMARAAPAAGAAPASPPPVTAPQAGGAAPPDKRPAPPHRRGCLREGNGYFRARIRGALDEDLDWHDADLVCEADVQPGRGIRLAFLGPLQGGQLRIILGIRGALEGRSAHELPANLTLILPGGRLYGTSGDDRCTIDRLDPRRLAGGDRSRRYRIEGRGFCVEPVNGLSGKGHLIISRFDFAGGIVYTAP